MLKMIFSLCLMMSFVSGCQSKLPENSFCDKAHPIYFDKTDKVSLETQREVYSHFEMGHELCGWSEAQ